jgi:hypothetical protein
MGGMAKSYQAGVAASLRPVAGIERGPATSVRGGSLMSTTTGSCRRTIMEVNDAEDGDFGRP